MSGKKTVFKNFFSLSLGEVFTRIGGTILTIIVARLLGVSLFGQFSFALAFVSYFSLFADFGLTTLGIREIAREKSRTNIYGTSILVIQILTSLILLVLLALIVLFLPLTTNIKILTVLFGLGLIPSALNMSYIIQAHQRMEYIALSKFIGQVIYVIGGITLIYIYRDIFVIPIVNFLAALVSSTLIFYYLKKTINFTFHKIDPQVIKSLSVQALPFVITSAAVQVYFNSDTLLLQFMKGESEVGYYNAAYRIVLLVFSIGAFYMGAVFPLLSASIQDKLKFQNILSISRKYLGIIALPATIGGILVGPQLIQFIYGSSYSSASLPFQILIIYPVLKFLSMTFEHPLVALSKVKLVTIAAVVTAIINVGLNLLLIPTFGMIGSATSTIFSEVVALVILAIYFRRVQGNLQSIGEYFTKPFIASVGMAVVLLLLSGFMHVTLLILLGATCYLAFLLLLKAVSVTEIKFLFAKNNL